MDKTPRRLRRTEEILEILDRFRKSGLSQTAFSKRNGLGASTLQYWLRKEREGRFASAQPRKKAEASNQLVPVKIVDAPTTSPVADETPIELDLPHGAKLRFSSSLSPDDLARYAKALGFRC